MTPKLDQPRTDLDEPLDTDHPGAGLAEPEVSAVRCVQCPALHLAPCTDPTEGYYSAVDAGWIVADGNTWDRMHCPEHLRDGPYWTDWACPGCGRLGFQPAARAWLTVADATLGAPASAVDRAVGPGDPPDDPAGSRLYRLRDSQPWQTLTRPLLAATTRALHWQWTVAWALEDAADRRIASATATTSPGTDGQP